MEQIYSPGAGHLPPAGVLPGREELIATWEHMAASALTHGRPRATDLVLTGNRGIGKTVAMKRCVEVAESQGYRVLAFQATRDTTLSAALLEDVRHHLEDDPHSGIWAKAANALARISGVSLSAMGASVTLSRSGREPTSSIDATGDPYNATGIGNVLAQLATQLRGSAGGGVVISVDEFQATDPRDIRTIGAVLNHLNNRHAGSPVLFIASGLPSTMDAMIGPDPERPHISNPSRLFRFEEPSQYLTADEVELALRAPALVAGGDWHRDAVRAVIDTTAGYPAHLQVVAAAAWSHAAGPTVGVHDVQASLPAARAEVDRMYNVPRWRAMGPVQKSYITALALCGGKARSGQVAAMIDRTTHGASPIRDALLRQGDVFAPRDGWVSLAQPLMAGYAPMAYRQTYRDEPGLSSLQEMATRRDDYIDGRQRPLQPDLSDDEVQALITPRPSPGASHERRPPDPGTPNPAGPAR